ncbi:hypothetical protein [Candidatus Laterigemmans baculatus]|uniref:hypothetical protein n=1 Tax=Candidatus Laterigemmans baculatus TaxID=2770505 RepID=UPI0013D98234|nr:hypothetical protein [Candidatus Laterigemmans baculatus]
MATNALLFVALLAASPTQHVVRDRVDLIELNHYYDEAGRHVFDQLIFYDWSEGRRRFEVCAWRLVKSRSQQPRQDHREHLWRVLWHDGGVLRSVEGASFRETWTKHDPELVDRDLLPQESRRELSKQPTSMLRHMLSSFFQ